MCADTSEYNYYLPFEQVTCVSQEIIREWWNRPLEATNDIEKTLDWQSHFQYIPTSEMMKKTLDTTVREMFMADLPHAQFPHCDAIMRSFLMPNTEWKLNVFRNVRNDYNSYNSGVVYVNDTVLVECQGESDLVYECLRITHVCRSIFHKTAHYFGTM